jgi:GTP-binding protein EngB required for normal cell division
MSAKKIVTDALKTFGRDVEIRCARHHPTLFSTADMELDDLNFLEYSAARSKLFDKSFFRYVPPKDFNYQLPSASRAETCFIGRSNVGKSSLIECLSGGRGIAKVSKSPGCTKTLNFFAFIPNRFQSVPELTTDHHRAYLVDMPGYGYAKVSREEQQRWLKVMNDYLLNRDQTVLR